MVPHSSVRLSFADNTFYGEDSVQKRLFGNDQLCVAHEGGVRADIRAQSTMHFVNTDHKNAIHDLCMGKGKEAFQD